MLLLISEKRKGERVYNEFINLEELKDYLRSRYKRYFCIENRNESQEELKSRIIEVCSQNSVPVHPHCKPIYEPEKIGSHLIAYNSNSGLEVVYMLFMCEAEEFSSEELSKMTQSTSQSQ